MDITNKILKIDSTIKKVNVITSVTPNPDKYAWRDLNCLYRPLATIFKSFEESYFNLFLLIVSFSNIYCLEEEFNNFDWNSNIPFFDVYERVFKSFFKINIESHKCIDEFDLHYKLISNLNNNKVILLPGNIKELTYNPMYKKENTKHFFILKGYDLERKIYFILDNIHVSGGATSTYTDFVMTFDEAYKLYSSYEDIMKTNDSTPVFWSISNNEPNNLSDNYVPIINKYISYLDEIINENKVMKHIELTIINEFLENHEVNDLVQKITIINMKKVYYDIILKLLNKLKVTKNEICSIYDKIQTIDKYWNIIKNNSLVAIERQSTDFTDLNKMAEENILRELNLINELRTIVKKELKKISVINSKQEYEINNKKNAIINIEDDRITISHNDKTTYDTWIVNDDAPQILWNVNKQEFTFSIRMKISSGVGRPFQSGIVLQLDTGDKLFFGNSTKQHINILYPLLIDNFKLIETVYLDPINSNSFMVTKKDNKLVFLVKNNDKNWTTLYSTEKYCNISKIGVFTKSWEEICNKVEFDKITLKIL